MNKNDLNNEELQFQSGWKSEPSARYVFDFSDTKSGANARAPQIWQYHDKPHRTAVSKALDQKYGRSDETDIAESIDVISEQCAREYLEVPT